MRVVRWDEFRALPEGTVYQEVARESWEVGPLMIFGGAEQQFSDFVEAPLLPQMNIPAVFHREGLQHIGVGKDDPVEVIFTPSGFGRPRNAAARPRRIGAVRKRGHRSTGDPRVCPGRKRPPLEGERPLRVGRSPPGGNGILRCVGVRQGGSPHRRFGTREGDTTRGSCPARPGITC